jgi:GT2 family glycosyltransferase/glycosyltransferase involved in cell wall biosynthesis
MMDPMHKDLRSLAAEIVDLGRGFGASRTWRCVRGLQGLARRRGGSDHARRLGELAQDLEAVVSDDAFDPRRAAEILALMLGFAREVRLSRSYRLVGVAAEAKRWASFSRRDPRMLDRLLAALEAAAGVVQGMAPPAAAEPAAAVLARLLASPPPRRPEGRTEVDVVIPVYNGLPAVLRCIESVLAAADRVATRHEVVVIDDASPDPELRDSLARLAEASRFTLLRNERNLGFVRTTNRGLSLHPDRDVVLLNSDTRVYGDWLDRLRGAALREPRAGTATPFSNNATICSYPVTCAPNSIPRDTDAESLDALFAACNKGRAVEVPTGVGFCMYFRRSCLDEVGFFDEERFGRGYGEENDFCMRAQGRGWKHLLAGDVFVYHEGGVSFEEERGVRIDAALRTLSRLHPEYLQRVREHVAADPARSLRRNADLARLATTQPVLLLVTHAWGGGVEQHVREMAALLEREGVRAVLLRPVEPGRVALRRLGVPGTPNLSFAVPDELPELEAALRSLRLAAVHVHQTVGLPPQTLDRLGRLGAPVYWTLHDYFTICPRIHLMDGSRSYCGEPPVQECDRCVRKNGSPAGDRLDVALWRQEHRSSLSVADRVFAPSADIARRMAKHFPGLRVAVRPHPEVFRNVRTARAAREQGEPFRVALLGSIGPHKGHDLLLGCAKDAHQRRLPLRFHVVGHTAVDEAFRPLPNVAITGPYDVDDVFAILAEQRCHAAFFASVWPETYSYTLSIAFLAGLYPLAFDLGAIGERIREAGWGEVIPLTKDPRTINDWLMRVAEGGACRSEPPPYRMPRYDSLLRDYYGLAVRAE